jgi:hypothetical protein
MIIFLFNYFLVEVELRGLDLIFNLVNINNCTEESLEFE